METKNLNRRLQKIEDALELETKPKAVSTWADIALAFRKGETVVEVIGPWAELMKEINQKG